MQRRDFIKRAVQAGAILPLASHGLFARPLSYSLFPRPAAIEDRVLVLINMGGGNDGLNTIIPFNDQIYYDSRPDIKIAQNNTLALTDNMGFHSSMSGIHDLYHDGHCAVINNVGYPNQNRSHFRSTDIWHTASEADEVLFTGWLGRYLESVHPEYPATLPDAPYAIQISASTSLALQGNKGKAGIAVDNPDRFFNLANGLEVVPDPLPNTLAGPELEFVRNIIKQSNTFSTEINNAVVGGSNYATYGNDNLANQMKVVARMINGGLPTSIYIVSIIGFDTHSKQAITHGPLLDRFSRAVSSFMQDMDLAGNGERVVCMSYSEFGRRLNQNGSEGTDHGAAAPQFVFGKNVRGGQLLGGTPDLVNLDERGDVKFTTDFRQIYTTLLQDWMGFGNGEAKTALGGDFEKLPLFATSSVPDREDIPLAGMQLLQNDPNPAKNTTTIRFSLPRAAFVNLLLVTPEGRPVQSLINRTIEEGDHRIELNTSPLPSGTYFYVLNAEGRRLSQKMVVVH